MGILDQPVVFSGQVLVPTTTSAMVVKKVGTSDREVRVDSDRAFGETFVQRGDPIVREVRPLLIFRHVRHEKELSWRREMRSPYGNWSSTVSTLFIGSSSTVTLRHSFTSLKVCSRQ